MYSDGIRLFTHLRPCHVLSLEVLLRLKAMLPPSTKLLHTMHRLPPVSSQSGVRCATYRSGTQWEQTFGDSELNVLCRRESERVAQNHLRNLLCSAQRCHESKPRSCHSFYNKNFRKKDMRVFPQKEVRDSDCKTLVCWSRRRV